MTLRQRTHLHYPDKPAHAFFRDAADRIPERLALRFDDELVTFRELDARGTCFANALTALGIGLGARVVLASGNRPEWLMAQHGISQTGAASVLVNSSWREVEVEHAFALTQPAAIVADGIVAERLASGALALPKVRVCLDDDAPAGWLRFWDLVTAASGTRPADLTTDLSRLEALLPFSSGTTGLPKAVRHSHRSIVAATIQRQQSYSISDADRLQFFMPLFTIYGVTVAMSIYASGASLRLLRRFDAPTVLRNLHDERITVAFGAAPIAVALRDQPDLESFDLSALRYMMWGATPVIPEIADEVTARAGIKWFVAYSTTEVGISANPVHRPDLWRLDSAGVPMSDVELRLVEPGTDVDVPEGGSGELVVRSSSAMMGYLPEEDDVTAFLPGGWVRTGDIAWIEPEEGWIHLTDRAKDLIKVNAFQVAPAEIERLLFTHPAIADCAVYGVPDARRGEVPKAAVVRVDGATLAADEVVAFVADRLATYKHLHHVEFVEEIPRNAGGKVLRRELRAHEPGLQPPT